MNVNNIYINDEITDNIYNILHYNDKISFAKVNKHSFTTYKDKIRHEVFNYINWDYNLFYDCLKRFNYNKTEKEKLLELSLKVNTVQTTTGVYGDLRFIFEICYKYRESYVYSNSPLRDRTLLSLMIKDIYNSISFDRYETVLNIEKKMILISLKRYFKPILWKTNEEQCIYLIRD